MPTITHTYDGDALRLDKAIKMLEPELSRNQIKALIDDGRVRVDGTVKKASFTVRKDMTIVLDIPSKTSQTPLVHHSLKLDIVYEDDDLLVVNKPSGLMTHPAQTSDEVTLLHGLLNAIDASKFDEPMRAGVVHRLDRHTSGLLLFAKNQSVLNTLQKQLANREIKRHYKALVHGTFAHQKGTIDAPIGRHPVKRHTMSVVSEGKASVTHFKILESFDATSFIECELESGRTHQIRVHMQYIDHPVIGDEIYGRKSDKNPFGQYLHAYKLTFSHPITQETLHFEANVPEAFQEKLEELRGHA